MAFFKSFFVRHTTILDRYLFRQFTGPFILAVGGFVLIAIVDILFYLLELHVISGVSLSSVIRLLVYKVPGVMVLFFPMAVLFAVMLLFVRMAKDNEITVLRTSGVHSARIMLPIILLALFTSYLSYLTNEHVAPWTTRASDQLIRKEIKKKHPPDIVENVVFKAAHNRHFYIKRIDRKTNTMHDILIMEETSHFPRITVAKEAQWDEKSWRLLDGQILEFDSDGSLAFRDQFSQMILHLDQDVQSYFSRQKSAREMDSKELRQKINVLNKGGISTRSLKVEYYMKMSIPMACFIFGLIGISFCFTFVRSGKDWWGVIIAICIAVLAAGFYLFIVALCRALAKNGTLDPFLGAWLPNIVYGSIGGGALFYQSVYK